MNCTEVYDDVAVWVTSQLSLKLFVFLPQEMKEKIEVKLLACQRLKNSLIIAIVIIIFTSTEVTRVGEFFFHDANYSENSKRLSEMFFLHQNLVGVLAICYNSYLQIYTNFI